MHEADLHRARIKIISNSALFEGVRPPLPLLSRQLLLKPRLKQAVKTALPSHLVARPFTSRQFLPPNFEVLVGKAPPTSTILGGKQIADAAEAVMGAAIETGYAQGSLNKAFELALMAAKALSMLRFSNLPRTLLTLLYFVDVELGEVNEWSDFARLYGSPGPQVSAPEQYRQVEEIFGYRFKHGGLVKEAFTHPSKLAEISFERSEFLGDSVRRFYLSSKLCVDVLRAGARLPRLALELEQVGRRFVGRILDGAQRYASFSLAISSSR
jgi:endoribonuclease Dicer